MIGNRIRTLREKAGLSCTEVERRAEMARGHLSRIETGKIPNIETDTLTRITEALGITMADLFQDPPKSSDAA